MKALIIGTGAIGCALAIATIDGGMETAVLARNKTAEYLRAHGLKRTGIFGDITIPADRFTVFCKKRIYTGLSTEPFEKGQVGSSAMACGFFGAAGLSKRSVAITG